MVISSNISIYIFPGQGIINVPGIERVVFSNDVSKVTKTMAISKYKGYTMVAVNTPHIIEEMGALMFHMDNWKILVNKFNRSPFSAKSALLGLVAGVVGTNIIKDDNEDNSTKNFS